MDEPVIELDAEQAAQRRRDADQVRKCLAGDQQAFGQLYDAWFDRVFDLVNRVVRDRDIAAEVAQEAFFSAWRNLATLEKPDAFGGWLLRIARNGAYNRSQKEQRSYAVDDQGLSVIESVGASPTGAPSGFGVEDRLGRAVTPGAAVEDAEIVALVWEAAEALPARDLEVLDLQLRHGLTPAEIGDVMGMNRNAANQLVHRLKNRLETAIRARVLWRGGSPSCEILAQRLRDLGIERFSAEAVRVAERHVPGCVDCDERQRLNLEPAALFAAVPLFVVPLALKQAAAAALATAGVPMGGSAFVAAAGVAGHAAAASSVGSNIGGAVDPGLGADIGHAIQAPGATNVSIGGDVGRAVAPGQPGAPAGSQVGSSVGGSIPGSEPASPIGSAAGQSVAPPTPIDAAATKAAEIAAADAVAHTAAATLAGPPPPSNTPRIILLSAAAAVVLALLFGAGLWWGGDGEADITASGPPASATGTAAPTSTLPGTTTIAPTTTDTVPGETTTPPSTDGPTSTTPGNPPTTPGNPPTTRGGTPTTQATTPTDPTNPTIPTTTPTTPTTPPTTQPTTTPTNVPTVAVAVSPNTGDTNGWVLTSGNPQIPAAPRTLTWSVTPATGYTAVVTGPTTLDYPNFGVGPVGPLRSTLSGSLNVCPGMRNNTGSYSSCTPPVGVYTYTITVKDGSGQVVVTKAATLTITQAIIY